MDEALDGEIYRDGQPKKAADQVSRHTFIFSRNEAE
jgi:hypothetical protein